MKPTTKQSSGRQANVQKLGLGALLGCLLLLPVALLSLTKSSSHHYFFPISSLQLSTVDEAAVSKQPPGANLTSLSLPLKAIHDRTDSVANRTTLSLPLKGTKEQTDTVADEKDAETNASLTQAPSGKQSQDQLTSEELVYQASSSQRPSEQEEAHQVSSEKLEKINQTTPAIVAKSELICDRSEPRSDTCSMSGDVRVLGRSSTILLSSLSSANSTTLKIRPYARKWEAPVMATIKELSLKPASEHSTRTPGCSVNHSVPAVVFSTGGFLGNAFHDFSDVLVPLFATSRQYRGEVQFLAADFNPKWVYRYRHILKQLSRYRVVDMDADDEVRCFPEAHIGLRSHRVLGMDPSKTPNGYSMLDFKRMLRASYSLNRASATKIGRRSKKKPRLLVILRNGSRSLINAKEVIRTARDIGYKVVTTAPEDTEDLARFAQVVNSCDAMMGVHGAGLANMVFLPTNASVIQIIPWGGLRWACRHDFGEPAPDMGLNYVEYEIREEESSLIEEYPRDHAVFTDPESIQKQGWNVLWYIFLHKQKVKLDVGRFREVLLQVYQSLKQ
ncbi:Uncharacterized protein M6B38_225620 [Iris pallida]|uniref:Glycosyltransferase 61 catalytic domain-containing protein n=1 Tax=Iris pallida TaxID=29817 RepID=A0AAX6DUW1_IRIPA|nr:Uncharacterized protein M6B38_225620 [Iris pallida]